MGVSGCSMKSQLILTESEHQGKTSDISEQQHFISFFFFFFFFLTLPKAKQLTQIFLSGFVISFKFLSACLSKLFDYSNFIFCSLSDGKIQYLVFFVLSKGFPSGSDGKVSVCNAGDLGSIPGLGRSPGEGNGSPCQQSCLENLMDLWSLVGYRPWGTL